LERDQPAGDAPGCLIGSNMRTSSSRYRSRAAAAALLLCLALAW
jgi:hypothetical protein